MKFVGCWLRRVIMRNTLFAFTCIATGGIVVWLWFNLSAGPGTVIIAQDEAEGPQFRDPGTLDIITTFKRNRVCPAVTQRWVWRWITVNGQQIPDAYPVVSTVAPFLADGGKVMLSLPNPAVSVYDRADKWFYRTVTTERCGFLPTWANVTLGTRIFRSKDEPVNFVGDSHDK